MRRVPADLPARLRAALETAGFTYDGVADAAGHAGARRAGPQRDGARTATDRRWQAAGDAGPAVPAAGAGRARRAPRPRCPGWSTGWRAEGLLERRVGEVAARLDVRPYAADDRRPVGGQRPDARAGRRPEPGRRRPRPRHQPGVDLAGPADHARARSAPPSTSAPAAASRRCTWPRTRPGRRHGREPARAVDDPAQRGAQRGRRTSRCATGRSSSRCAASAST